VLLRVFLLEVASPASSHAHFAAAGPHSQVAFSHARHFAGFEVLLLVVGRVPVLLGVARRRASLVSLWVVWLHRVVGLRTTAPPRVVRLVLAMGHLLVLLLIVVVIARWVVVAFFAGRRPPVVLWLSATTVLALFIVVVLHVRVFVRRLVTRVLSSVVAAVLLLHCTASSSHGTSATLLVVEGRALVILSHLASWRHPTIIVRRHSTIFVLVVVAIVHFRLVATPRSSPRWPHWRLLIIISIILVVILSVSVVGRWWSLVEMEVVSTSHGGCIAPLS
jgi:hypothetical protein